jgi:hypothetical protein
VEGVYVKLADLRYEAGTVDAELRIALANQGGGDKKLRQLIERGNKICRQLNDLIIRVGPVG